MEKSNFINNILNEQIKKYLENGCENECECSICLEKNEISKSKISCGHIFHTNCIDKWIYKKLISKKKISCPICRKTIIKINNIIENEEERKKQFSQNFLYFFFNSLP